MSLVVGRRAYALASCGWNKIRFRHHLHQECRYRFDENFGAIGRKHNYFNTLFPSFSNFSVPKRVSMRNHSYENVFLLHVHFYANQTLFHMKGFARELALKWRHKVTWKWLILVYFSNPLGRPLIHLTAVGD